MFVCVMFVCVVGLCVYGVVKKCLFGLMYKFL